ncbi:hypothetical protein BDQ17DRAFT_1354152 [Cyathus striatus]|nr:hypothetical protein BDQ17DRAFT_1354152 [Cyathus striatus]
MSLSPDMACAVAIWVETLLYGMYTCLYFEALYVMTKKVSKVTSTKIFLGTTVVMHLVATIHIIINCYRLLRAFVLHVEPLGPAAYFMSLDRWDNLTHNALICVMTWLGDGLVIYRCYIIWNYNYYTIILPVVLLVVNFAVNVYLLYWFDHGSASEYPKVVPWLNTVYPLAFTENVLTTGLIALKIWNQHRISTRAGIVDHSSRHSLFNILRIIVESAMIYTVQLMILIILYPLQNLAQVIIQSAIVPSIGIVFVLIAVRVHLTKSKTIFGPSRIGIPSWLNDSDHEGGDSDRRVKMTRSNQETEDTDHTRTTVLSPFRPLDDV